MKSKEEVLERIEKAKKKVAQVDKQIIKIEKKAQKNGVFPFVFLNINKTKAVLLGSITALEWVLEETNH